MQIKLINQPDDYTCGVACAAMVAGVPFEHALELSPPIKGGMTPRDMDVLLTRLGVQFERLLYPEPAKTCPFIITVPSLNVVAGTHYVVLDISNAVCEVYDPQYKRPGKRYYARTYNADDGGVPLKGYAEVIQITYSEG